jgi:EipB-like
MLDCPPALKGLLTMNHVMLTRCFCATAIFVFGHSFTATAASLAPHRAFYILESDKLEEKAGITSIAGKLAYEITGNECDGYAVSYRVANRYVQGEGSAQTQDIQMTSFEAGDGSALDMRQKSYNNGSLATESRVKAAKPKFGEKGTGELEAKENKSFEIVAEAIFPTAFQKQLMVAASKGETRASAVVFEGSDDQKSTRAISFIGSKKPASKITSGADAATLDSLNQLPYWPVTVSYYNLEAQGDEPPTYSASFNMLENGVSTDLVLDYGSYSLKGKLEKIEMLKADSCK